MLSQRINLQKMETASLVDPNDSNLTSPVTIKIYIFCVGTAIEIPLCEWNPDWLNLPGDTPGTTRYFRKPFIQGMRPRAFDTCLGRTSCSYRGMAPCGPGGNWVGRLGDFCWISATHPCHGCIDAICIYVCFHWGFVARRDILQKPVFGIFQETLFKYYSLNGQSLRKKML